MLNITMEQRRYENYINSLTRQLRADDVKVVYYGYRTARLEHVLCNFERNSYCCDKLEEALAAKSGGHVDNHTAYEVTFADGATFAIRCSDGTLSIGVGISKGPW